MWTRDRWVAALAQSTQCDRHIIHIQPRCWCAQYVGSSRHSRRTLYNVSFCRQVFARLCVGIRTGVRCTYGCGRFACGVQSTADPVQSIELPQCSDRHTVRTQRVHQLYTTSTTHYIDPAPTLGMSAICRRVHTNTIYLCTVHFPEFT